MIRPTFQMFGITSVFMERFSKSVRYDVAFPGPRSLSMIGAMLSGPRALDVLVPLIAKETSSLVKS